MKVISKATTRLARKKISNFLKLILSLENKQKRVCLVTNKHQFDLTDITKCSGRISVARQFKSLAITKTASNDLKIAEIVCQKGHQLFLPLVREIIDLKCF